MKTDDFFQPWDDALLHVAKHAIMRADQEYTEVLVHLAGDDPHKLSAKGAEEFIRLLGDRKNIYWRAAPRIEEQSGYANFLPLYTIRARALTW